MRMIALFGTESGNAEDAARAIAKELPDLAIEVENMADAAPDDIDRDAFYFITCSTHGGGELPGFAQFLHDDLDDLNPDLTGLRYAMFGLGDTTYEKSYNRGSHEFDELLTRLGAQRVGPFGEHDVMSRQDPAASAAAWARAVVDELRP
ncbi:MioC protein [Microbacterium sp. cf046]|uniref:flavodoxin family protein n=1 Tax=Microbacterium sp. cf046 TaxID=1761803 RepID=UPI0008EC4E47|nr:flavodoxin family protein [Microbacterium sp. cf046]SFR89689.1 MioC protein [Microbacterium sp. cf046]